MFTKFWSWIKSIFSKQETKPQPVPSKPSEEPDESETSGRLQLWYPDRVRTSVENLRMRTRGKYKKGYPQGAVVHYTAGRSRDKTKCGRGKEHIEQGIRGVRSAVKNRSFVYFVIDRDGNVFQNFPLNEWGYHAGSSSYPGLPGSVSDELVGIEVQNAGKLTKVKEGLYKAWFTKTEKGDGLFTEEEVRYTSGKDNQQRGYYHKYSEAQEEALLKLLRWMHDQGHGIFSYDFVVGHDEVAPSRKADPGASLSMTMPELRKLLKSS
jgi:hypothetical protein